MARHLYGPMMRGTVGTRSSCHGIRLSFALPSPRRIFRLPSSQTCPHIARSMASGPPVVVVEDDPWTRPIGVVLDPTTSAERLAAFADFMAHDEPQFARWCDELRARAGELYPADVRLVRSPAELRANLRSEERRVGKGCSTRVA